MSLENLTGWAGVGIRTSGELAMSDSDFFVGETFSTTLDHAGSSAETDVLGVREYYSDPDAAFSKPVLFTDQANTITNSSAVIKNSNIEYKRRLTPKRSNDDPVPLTITSDSSFWLSWAHCSSNADLSLSYHKKDRAAHMIKLNFFEGPMCPDNCHGNGQCVDGQCVCTGFWQQPDCSELAHGTLAINLDSELTLSWQIDEEAGLWHGALQVDRSSCWASLGFRSSSTLAMADADFIIGQVDPSETSDFVQEYHTDPNGCYNRPVLNTKKSINASSVTSFSDSVVYTFSRLLNPPQDEHSSYSPLPITRDLYIMWAYCASAGTASLDYHGASRSAETIALDLFTGDVRLDTDVSTLVYSIFTTVGVIFLAFLIPIYHSSKAFPCGCATRTPFTLRVSMALDASQRKEQNVYGQHREAKDPLLNTQKEPSDGIEPEVESQLRQNLLTWLGLVVLLFVSVVGPAFIQQLLAVDSTSTVGIMSLVLSTIHYDLLVYLFVMIVFSGILLMNQTRVTDNWLGCVHQQFLSHNFCGFGLGTMSRGDAVVVLTFVGSCVWVVGYHINHSTSSGLSSVAKVLGRLIEWLMSFLLLPVTRNSVWVQVFAIPFERALRYHRWLGVTFYVTVVAHLMCWWVYWAQDQNWTHYVLANSSDDGLNHSIWTGELTALFLTVMVIGALEPVRRRCYEVFYYLHRLFIVVVMLAIMHSVAVQGNLLTLLTPALTLYVLDWILRTKDSGSGSWKLTRLERLKDSGLVAVSVCPTSPSHSLASRAGQYVFLNIPVLGRFQWHPFSVAAQSDPVVFSASGIGRLASSGSMGSQSERTDLSWVAVPRTQRRASQSHISVRGRGSVGSNSAYERGGEVFGMGPSWHFYIKDMGAGTWTYDLALLATSQPITAGSISTKLPEVRVDGPYGSIDLDLFEHSSIVLVAGGVGMTPLGNVLSELLAGGRAWSGRLKRVTVVWVVRDAKQFTWMHKVLVKARQFELFDIQCYVSNSAEKLLEKSSEHGLRHDRTGASVKQTAGSDASPHSNVEVKVKQDVSDSVTKTDQSDKEEVFLNISLSDAEDETVAQGQSSVIRPTERSNRLDRSESTSQMYTSGRPNMRQILDEVLTNFSLNTLFFTCRSDRKSLFHCYTQLAFKFIYMFVVRLLC